MTADETPLERLGRLAGELAIDATRADVTGEEAIPVGHEWADEMVRTVAEVRADHKPTPREAWAAMGPAAKLVVGSASVFLSAVFLGLAWIVVAKSWDVVASVAAGG